MKYFWVFLGAFFIHYAQGADSASPYPCMIKKFDDLKTTDNDGIINFFANISFGINHFAKLPAKNKYEVMVGILTAEELLIRLGQAYAWVEPIQKTVRETLQENLRKIIQGAQDTIPDYEIYHTHIQRNLSCMNNVSKNWTVPITKRIFEAYQRCYNNLLAQQIDGDEDNRYLILLAEGLEALQGHRA